MPRNPFAILGRSKGEDKHGYGGGEATCGGGEGTCGGSHPSQPGAPPGRPQSPEISEAAPTIAGLPPTLGVDQQPLDVKGLAEAMAQMMPHNSSAVAAAIPGGTYDQPQRRDPNYLDDMWSTWR
jgi:hypothetical protein